MKQLKQHEWLELFSSYHHYKKVWLQKMILKLNFFQSKELAFR
ncbi:hypothetical protein [Mycoplasmopsis gallinarum]|nr:hypothetical protein [Mycoplasmopsis gallinarum]